MNNPTLKLDNAAIYLGHNLDVLKTFADNSVDSIVTDPPYELGFMGKQWDSSGIAYSVELWRECLRVLKPGGHLLAFGGSRTWHRLAVAIEDAGFEMRDSIAWLYGSGFPKSHNISKAIDKAAGVEREIVGIRPDKGRVSTFGGGETKPTLETLSATDDAKKWDGWGTALKPAFEPIVVARKPLIGTVAENVLQHGTGGLNIDASRIGTETVTINTFDNGAKPFGDAVGEPYTGRESVGRWPANIILDETTAELLDQQTEGKTSQGHWAKTTVKGYGEFGGGSSTYEGVGRKADDSGGASRFFYVAKASKRDRNEGLDELPIKRPDLRTTTAMGSFEEKGIQPQRNFHPTVKPTSLMTYLIKLVTPPNGTVLDPFAGSGSTGKAAILEGYKFIGIELTAEYLPIIEGRLKHAEQTYNNKPETLFDE